MTYSFRLSYAENTPGRPVAITRRSFHFNGLLR
nr:MAG TPA: hypothetical protein [Caudoviricetes sp.]